ncbi:probable nucleoredoxin 1 [Macadamia integrifolia]|uniref:probable nucleoredoxin 1 n=1 Tax=Macadamia integrifolia TaxID=60698 RepID=UPI001C4E9359|nr:probable nucleoredoxin 1 [Macadamia integrifolia]
MEAGEGMANGNNNSHDTKSLLSSSGRDFLIRNNGDQVKCENLSGKNIGLYFSASWCGPCRRFTPNLVDVYNELCTQGDLEIIFVSADKDENSFNEYFSKMPWLAIPFSDSETRDQLNKLFIVRGIPNLVILDGNGEVVSKSGVQIISDYGVEGYPFTAERVTELKEREKAAKEAQSLSSILVSQSRDFLVSNDGKRVPVIELEGKTVGLYFSMSRYGSCIEFTPLLVEVYEKLKEKGEKFEVVLVSLDDVEETFKEDFQKMPWLALPCKDKSCNKLVRYFELRTLPTLVIVGPDGKTLNPNVAEIIENHGVQAYPFTPEKLEELARIEEARLEAQTLESILVLKDRDFVISKDGTQIPVTQLVGKNILLYFSAEWCPPCRAFLPKLINAYHEIKAMDDAFEVIFISSDRDQASFDEFFSKMPWLALPYGDERKKFLSRRFKISGIPTAIAIGSTGKTVTKDARELLMVHGADAYPFTEERLKEIEVKLEELAKQWPKKVKHVLHEEHELVLTRRPIYDCDGCGEEGKDWSFLCEECNYDLHPKCALEVDKGEKDDVKDVDADANDGIEQASKEGWICDGEACQKA